ncbi:MAG: 3-hydroxy-3-methylglutaryl-coenzyme A (HMG-CoA) reductase isozyme, partial [Thelocarpon superellum]
MSVASFLPMRWAGSRGAGPASKPGWLNRQVTSILQSLSRRACNHPIHTIVFVALLASTTYMGLLEGRLFDAPSHGGAVHGTDWGVLTHGSKSLRVGPDTGWKWQMDDKDPATVTAAAPNAQHLALLTFVFSGSLSSDLAHHAPPDGAIPTPQDLGVSPLPSTSSLLSPLSHDSTLAFSLPYTNAPNFLALVQEIPN